MIPPCTIPSRVTNISTARKTEVLHVFILDDKAEKVEDFITTKNVPVDMPNHSNQTPLFCAAYCGNERTVVKLLQLGADPNKGCGQFSRYTPVHGACYSGNARVLSYLVESGGDLRVRDEFGRTPRDWAEGYINRSDKRLEILAVIESYRELANGSDVNPLDALNRRSKSKIPRPISQILNLPHVKHRESVPSPFGYIQATGFGSILCGRQVMMGHIPVRRILETDLEDLLDKNDLNSGKDIYELAAKKAVPYRCGETTEFYPRRWRDTVVTIRRLVEADLKLGNPATTAQNLLIHELENLRELNGPGMLQLLGVIPVQTHTQISLLFEGVQYGSLYRYLHESNTNDFTEKRILLLLSQIANALKWLHNSGYLHLALSSHSIHLVGPHQAKLGNVEFATKARGDTIRTVYTQRPWETFRNTYWNWMSPEVLLKEVPSKMSDTFSLCVVVYEVMTRRLPWMDRDREDITHRVKQYRDDIEHHGKEDSPYFNVGGTDLPSYVKTLLSRGLLVVPETRCDASEIYAMLRRQALAAFKTALKNGRTGSSQSDKQSAYPIHSEPSEGSEGGTSASSLDGFVTARDSGVFGTPEVPVMPHEDDTETEVSSTSGSSFVQKPVKTLVRRFSMNLRGSEEQGYESKNSTQYHSVVNTPEPPSKPFSRRLSLPAKKKDKSSSVDSSVKISVLPRRKSPDNTMSTSSWGKILNSSRSGILKITKKMPSTPDKAKRVEESYQHSFGATSPLDQVDGPEKEPVYATVKKVRKKTSSFSSEPLVQSVPPPPPPMPNPGAARKPASHFSAPNVFDPAAPDSESARRPRSAEEPQRSKDAYMRLPNELRSVIAHRAHVIENQNEFDRSQWQLAMQKEKAIKPSARRDTATQTFDFRESNSSDELKFIHQSDSDESTGSFARHARTSTPQSKGPLRPIPEFTTKSQQHSVCSYNDFSHDPHMAASSPFSKDDQKKRSVSFFEPGDLPQRPYRSKDSSTTGSMYETANEVSEPEKFMFGVPATQSRTNDVVRPTTFFGFPLAQNKARYSPPPKPLRTFEATKPLVPYEDSVCMSQNTSLTKEVVITARNGKISPAKSASPDKRGHTSDIFESLLEPNHTGSSHSSAPTVVDVATSPMRIGWPTSSESSDRPELPHTTITENSHMCYNHGNGDNKLIGFEETKGEVANGKHGKIGFEVVKGEWENGLEKNEWEVKRQWEAEEGWESNNLGEGDDNVKNENAENEKVEELGLGEEVPPTKVEQPGVSDNDGTRYLSVVEDSTVSPSNEEVWD